MKLDYYGPPEGEGAGFTWKGNDAVGTGRWEITEVEGDHEVEIALEVGGMGKSEVEFEFKSLPNNMTEVEWCMEKDWGWLPMMRLMTPLFADYITKDFTQGLKNLEAEMEKMRMGHVEKIEVMQMDGFPVLGMRKTVGMHEIGDTYGMMFGAIATHVQQNSIPMHTSGHPMGIYYSWDEKARTTDMEAAIPTLAMASPGNGMTAHMIDGGMFLVASYWGPYQDISMAHMAVQEYAKQHNHQLDGVAYEQYVVGMRETQDPAKLHTLVCYRVKP
jgi:effector-binding domain-containing protein